MKSKAKYITAFPKPLLDDLVADAWLPVIGAGFSSNALLPAGKKVPLWDELGRAFAKDLEDYPYSGALDAISAYEHEYGRTKLIERLGTLLHIQQTRPSDAHRAFCEIPFRIVCTTNFDFLLERQYGQTPNYCRPVVDEQQLAVNSNESALTLLKLHGDLHHPERLVVSESDYDSFLHRYPLLATYLANLLITRTAVLIGYSLDDPDFRQIWNVVSERLGKSRRAAYAILVDAKPTDISRYERRGVKVISLPGRRENYRQILTATFTEIRDYLQSSLIPASQVTEEDSLKELSLPEDAKTRLCFFAMPLHLQSLYREYVFPIAREAGFVPMLATDMVSPGENYLAKISALIKRAALVVVDESSPFTVAEVQLALQDESKRVLTILPDGAPLKSDIAKVSVIHRPKDVSGSLETFLNQLQSWFLSEAVNIKDQLASEPQRLFNGGEFRAAVISAMTLLETKLVTHAGNPSDPSGRVWSVRGLIDAAVKNGKISASSSRELFEWMQLRNMAVHTAHSITKTQAKQVVSGVLKIAEALE